MMNKLFPFLLALVLSACTTPAQTVDTGNSQKSSHCQCVKCQCQHCKKDACDCAHDKTPAKSEMCDIKGSQ